jgi:hypothetical protein
VNAEIAGVPVDPRASSARHLGLEGAGDDARVGRGPRLELVSATAARRRGGGLRERGLRHLLVGREPAPGSRAAGDRVPSGGRETGP